MDGYAEMLQVDVLACTGCGVCVPSCPQGAIRMVDEKAEIALRLCTSCGACTEVCPVGAIVVTEEVQPTGFSVLEPRTLPVPLQPQVISSKQTEAWARRLLDFANRWLVPSLADGLIAALDRRLSSRASPTITPTGLVGALSPTGREPGYRRRKRRRGR